MSGGLLKSVRRWERAFRRAAERAYFRLLMTGMMVWSELAFRRPPPVWRRLGHLRRGFSTKSAVVYGLERGDAARYLPDTSWPRMMRLNGRFAAVLDNKLLFHQVLQPWREHVPGSHALILEGQLFPLGGRGAGPVHDCLGYLEERLPVVIKPVGGAASRGVRFLTQGEGGFLVNDEPRAPADLRRLVAKLHEHLVCERVKPHPVVEGLYPHATATVKVLSVRDVGGEAFIPHACVRLGTDASRPFDALGRGGVTARIGLVDGRLGVARGLFTPEEAGWQCHPDTGVRIEGVLLPHWQLIRERLLEMCRALPYLKHLVWDLVVTEEGFKILEGNNHPGLTLIQMHSPLLADPRLRAFYARHGVIRR